MRVSFHRVIDYASDEVIEEMDGYRFVICGFKTSQHGILQVGYRGDDKIVEYSGEPSLQNYTENEREYIKQTVGIVYRMIFDAPKHERYIS